MLWKDLEHKKCSGAIQTAVESSGKIQKTVLNVSLHKDKDDILSSPRQIQMYMPWDGPT